MKRPLFDHLIQLLEKCGAVRAAWKARHNQPNQPPPPPHPIAGPPDIPPALAQQKPLPPAFPQPPSYPNPNPNLQTRDPQSYQHQRHSFSHAQADVQGPPVQMQPQIGTGHTLPNGEVRYGPMQVSIWSKVTGPAMWGGMYR